MVKFPDWIYRQSAVLPYRQENGKLQLLLITSRKARRWVLPKGIVEPGLTPRESAAKEAREEAGIEGGLPEHPLGSYKYEKWDGTCEVEVYPMKVAVELEDWPEAAIRQRKWLSVGKAEKLVDERALKKLIRQLPEVVAARTASDDPPVRKDLPRRVIYLFRHAKSSWDDLTLEDIDRPLAPRGRRACAVMRDYLRLADVKPDLILCSPSARTRETLQAVKSEFGEGVKTRFEKLIYHGEASSLMKQLRSLPDSLASVMLIGHNPGLQDLAVSLVGDGDPELLARMNSKFPTAALALLILDGDHWDDLSSGSCELHSFVVPRELA